jgi:hypothetical protein
MTKEIDCTVRHLMYREDITRQTVKEVQKAKETERLATKPNSLKIKQKDVVDDLIAKGREHKSIRNLLKRHPNTKQS